MANVTETPTYDAGVYRIETSDPVIGGESGISNAPHKNLANRTAYLKVERDAIVSKLDAAGIGAITPYTGDLNSLKTSGFHFADTGYTNGPVAGNGHVIVDRKDTNSVVQFFSVEASDAVYFRRCVGGTWQSWKRFLSGSDADALVQPGDVITSARSVPQTGFLKCNGAVISRTTYANLFNSIGLQFSKRFKAFDVANILIVNQNAEAHGFSTGDAATVQAEAGNTLPSPLVDGTTYYVRSASSSSLQLHPTNTDAVNNTNAISISTTQYFRIFAAATFPIPDLRGEFIRGWDDARGIDSSRVFGSSQKGSAVPIDATGTNVGATYVSSLHPTSMSSNEALAASLIGVDLSSSSEYPSTNATYLSTTNVGGFGYGVARPRNVALSHFIKY